MNRLCCVIVIYFWSVSGFSAWEPDLIGANGLEGCEEHLSHMPGQGFQTLELGETDLLEGRDNSISSDDSLQESSDHDGSSKFTVKITPSSQYQSKSSGEVIAGRGVSFAKVFDDETFAELSERYLELRQQNEQILNSFLDRVFGKLYRNFEQCVEMISRSRSIPVDEVHDYVLSDIRRLLRGSFEKFPFKSERFQKYFFGSLGKQVNQKLEEKYTKDLNETATVINSYYRRMKKRYAHLGEAEVKARTFELYERFADKIRVNTLAAWHSIEPSEVVLHEMTPVQKRRRQIRFNRYYEVVRHLKLPKSELSLDSRKEFLEGTGKNLLRGVTKNLDFKFTHEKSQVSAPTTPYWRVFTEEEKKKILRRVESAKDLFRIKCLILADEFQRLGLNPAESLGHFLGRSHSGAQHHLIRSMRFALDLIAEESLIEWSHPERGHQWSQWSSDEQLEALSRSAFDSIEILRAADEAVKSGHEAVFGVQIFLGVDPAEAKKRLARTAEKARWKLKNPVPSKKSMTYWTLKSGERRIVDAFLTPRKLDMIKAADAGVLLGPSASWGLALHLSHGTPTAKNIKSSQAKINSIKSSIKRILKKYEADDAFESKSLLKALTDKQMSVLESRMSDQSLRVLELEYYASLSREYAPKLIAESLDMTLEAARNLLRYTKSNALVILDSPMPRRLKRKFWSRFSESEQELIRLGDHSGIEWALRIADEGVAQNISGSTALAIELFGPEPSRQYIAEATNKLTMAVLKAKRIIERARDHELRP